MRTTSIELIRCPNCKDDLIFLGQPSDGSVLNGNLICKNCRRTYYIEDGIVHFLQENELPHFKKRVEIFRSFYSNFYTPATNLMFIPCGGKKSARNEVLERLEIYPGAKILETGIGTGDNLPFLKERLDCSFFYGVDIQQKMLRMCKKNLKKWDLKAELIWADAEHLPFKDHTFDVVFHLGAINLFNNKKRAIEEMIRVALPGSKIVIADETQKAAKFFQLFIGKQDRIVPPVDLIPKTMLDIQLDIIWRKYGYLIEFRTPIT